MFQGKVAVVTGGAGGIGAQICREFARLGAQVCLIDQADNPCFVGDVGDPAALEAFAGQVIGQYGRVDFLVNNAPPPFLGIDRCDYQQFVQALKVGVVAPYYLTRLLAPHLGEGASVVNISSTRQFMSQPYSESYSAAKGGIGALTHALAASLAGKARVNAISPGWIDTQGRAYTGPDAVQHPAGRVGRPQDIAAMVMYLCSPPGRIYHRPEFHHRRGHDPADDLPRRRGLAAGGRLFRREELTAPVIQPAGTGGSSGRPGGLQGLVRPPGGFRTSPGGPGGSAGGWLRWKPGRDKKTGAGHAAAGKGAKRSGFSQRLDPVALLMRYTVRQSPASGSTPPRRECSAGTGGSSGPPPGG